MRLASYNIRKSVGLDWRRDPARTLRVIESLDADIVALQEADKRLPPRLPVLGVDKVRAIGLEPVDLQPEVPSLGWHGNALLLGPRCRMIGLERIELPGLEPRGAAIVDLETPAGPLTVAICHLGLRRTNRQSQLRALLYAIGPRMPRAVLMGDMNEWSLNRGFEPLEGSLTMIEPGRSFHASRPIASLDRFAIGDALRCVEAGVHMTPEAARASDHLPVWARIAPADDLSPAPRP
ncbi:metal-dependent hydrolase [Palleronia sediminis]|uniref:Metal-dependent hydrolase n=1 Tax=Palleronia sediminis TaxID=2547833 RepID=A0A4R5ZVD5_9RHOB|nr:endonuclease/exonuclease/phosphatase family protein [Palleronia sediminis]TDL75010.1 metal-dependent hydrolase [Palleronia sediminis]